VVPRRHFGEEVIRDILAGNTDGIECESSTIVRIKKWFAANETELQAGLTSVEARHESLKGHVCFSLTELRRKAEWLKDLAVTLVNSFLWPPATKAMTQNNFAST
jgi:hypothetical protein